MTFIVGIGHKARVGKDTVAEALVRDLGFRKVAFADLLRDLAMGADALITSGTRTVNVDIGHGRFAWAVRGMGYEAAKNTYPELRAFLERLGKTARDVFGENFWFDMAIARALESGPLVVMPDVRYLNEAEGIRALGGTVIRINRPGSENRPTDKELDGFTFDYEYRNVGSVQDMQADVVSYVKGVLAERVAA